MIIWNKPFSRSDSMLPLSEPWPLLRLILLLCCLSWLPDQASGAEGLAVIADGKPRVVVVTAAEPDRAAQFAAHELRYHLEQMTGGKIAIVQEGEPREGIPIFVGETQAARAAGFTRESLGEQEYVVRIGSEDILLVGRDAKDPGKVFYNPEKHDYRGLPSFWAEQGTLYAAYDFLEKECGVRWLEPTRYGTVIPTPKNLVLAPKDLRETPSFVYRDTMAAGGDHPAFYDAMVGYHHKSTDAFRQWREEAHADLVERFTDPKTREAHMTVRARLHLLRMRNGGKMERCNHSFYGYYERFWDNPETRRPEFFAKGYEGQKPPQLCYTNPELIKQVAADAARYYDTGKSDDISWKPTLPNPFPVAPNDNGSYCKCAECKAFLPEDAGDPKGKGTKDPFFSNGKYSDYFFHFVNEVVRELKKTHPDKSVITLAYSSYTAPPARVKLDPSVEVQFTLPANRDDRPVGSFKHEMELLRQWRQDGSNRRMTMWLYNTFPLGIARQQKLNSWPGIFSHALGRQMRQFRDLGVKGFFHCGLAQDVDQYLTMRLMFDVDQNVDQLMNEYFTGLYGAAAEPVKEFYKVVEERYTEMGSGLNEREVEPYTKEILVRLGALLIKADTLAKTERAKGNLRLLRLGIWRYLEEAITQREDRIANQVPSVEVPQVAPANGDAAAVRWEAGFPIRRWYQAGSLNLSEWKLLGRIAHDEKFLYLELTDEEPSAEIASGWEISVAARRGVPMRQYTVTGEGVASALSHGEVNFRMNVPLIPAPVQASSISLPERQVVRLVWPLDNVILGGIRPGTPFYLNITRSRGIDPVVKAVWGPRSVPGEMKQSPELQLQSSP